jgi:hypothetical protein
MKEKEHRLGVSEATLVVRHLKLCDMSEQVMVEVVKEIDAIYGMDSVCYDKSTHTMHIAYDASRICIDCIEKVLRKYAVDVSHNWWTHFKESYYRLVDENIKTNASNENWSCHSSASGSSKK